MKVHVNLYASLAANLPANSEGSACTLEVDDGATVGTLLRVLGIEADFPKILFLNGVHADLDTVVSEGDRVAVFPPIAGG